MKLDLLYELHAPKPWGKPHPYGQREAEQKTYFEALEQVKLADRLGFGTAWFVEHHFREGRSHCPAPEVVIGALSQVTENIRLGFGVTLMPHPFTPPMRVAGSCGRAVLRPRCSPRSSRSFRSPPSSWSSPRWSGGRALSSRG